MQASVIQETSLVLRYFEFVSVLKPKAFLMENVPGILWDRHKKYLNAFYGQGEKAGYKIWKPIIIDARDYGIPQRRRRVFILGVKNDLAYNSNWPPQPTHGDEKARIHNSKLKPWVTAQSVFSKPVLFMDENNIHMNHSQKLISVFKFNSH